MSSTAVRERILETKLHSFKGKFPDVPTYPHVDTTLLYEGDEKPFHISLPIATIGETSGNGLVYDEALVSAIENQLPGLGGIRGHLRDEDLAYGFPLDAIDWVGSLRVGETLWAKGYIPPGDTREDVRRRMARGAGIGTSVFGDAVRETLGAGKWKAKEFKLDSLDLGKPGRVARHVGKGAFNITREYQEEGKTMPDNNITIADVPVSVREQILREAQIQADAARVSEFSTRISELEGKNKLLEQQVAEAAQWKNIVAEIRGTIGKDTDTVQIVTEYHQMATKLAELLGVPYTNVSIRVEEMHEQLAESKRREFDSAVDAKIVEFTNWIVNKDDAKVKVAAFRKNMKRAVVGELNGATDTARIAETAQKLWDEEFKPLGESLVREFGGPAALVAPHHNSSEPRKLSDEEVNRLASRYLPTKG